MAAEYSFREFQENQQRTLDQAVRAYQAYLETLEASRPFKGGMHWKKIRGREYLYQYRDRYGHGESLGPRSPSTRRAFGPTLPGSAGRRPPAWAPSACGCRSRPGFAGRP